MPLLARIDPDGFFLGVETVDALPSPMPQDRVPLPDGHDLEERAAAGRAPRWDAKAGSWHFLVPPTPEELVEQPHALRAIAKGFAAIRDGKPLPQETLDWLDWYERSLDAH
jgi:hypothetical protein